MTLPNFLIIGAMRSGTTTLARTLGEHPDVFMVRDKELHYFDTWPDKGTDWYESRFRDVVGERAIGEATPNYLYVDGALERAASVIPDARLLVILRDPVERAYSHYWWNRLRQREPLTFLEALAAEPERVKADPRGAPAFAYLGKGRYASQLRHACSIFPREALHVVILEDLQRTPEQTLRDVFAFLEVDSDIVTYPAVPRLNPYYGVRSRTVSRLVRRIAKGGPVGRAVAAIPARLNRVEMGYPPMPAEAYALLQGVFAPEIEELEVWLGRDLSMWATREASQDRDREASMGGS